MPRYMPNRHSGEVEVWLYPCRTPALEAGGYSSYRRLGGLSSPQRIAIPTTLFERRVKKHRALVLSIVSCGYETLSLTLRDEHRLLVFENRVLRKVFGPKREQVTGDWTKLLNDLVYSSFSLFHTVVY